MDGRIPRLFTRAPPLVRNITPMMRRYRRNYFTPLSSALAAGEIAPFDCVTEAWFDSEGAFHRSLQILLADFEKTTALAKDEENLFYRSTIRIFTASRGRVRVMNANAMPIATRGWYHGWNIVAVCILSRSVGGRHLQRALPVPERVGRWS